MHALKRILILILTLSLLFTSCLVFVGCDSSDNGDDTEINDPNGDKNDDTNDNTDGNKDDSKGDTEGYRSPKAEFEEFWNSAVVNREREIKTTKYRLRPKYSDNTWYERAYADVILDTLSNIDISTFTTGTPVAILNDLNDWIESRCTFFEFHFYDTSNMILNVDSEGYMRIAIKDGHRSEKILYTKSDITNELLIDLVYDITGNTDTDTDGDTSDSNDDKTEETPPTPLDFDEFWNSVVVNREYKIKKIRCKRRPTLSYDTLYERIYADVMLDTLSTIDKSTFTEDAPLEISNDLDTWLESQCVIFEIHFSDASKMSLHIDGEGYMRMAVNDGICSEKILYTKSDIEKEGIVDLLSDFMGRFSDASISDATQITAEEFKKFWNDMIIERKYNIEKIDYRSLFSIFIVSNIQEPNRIDNYLKDVYPTDLSTISLTPHEEILDEMEFWLNSNTYKYSIYFYEYQKYDYRLDVHIDRNGLAYISLRGNGLCGVFYAECHWD